MKKSEIEIIEKELNIALPEYYKNELKKETLAYYDDRDFLFYDYKKLIRTNKRLREKGYRGERFIPNHFVIGSDYQGSYNFIDVTKNTSKVYKVDRNQYFRYSANNPTKWRESFDEYIYIAKLLKEIRDDVTILLETDDFYEITAQIAKQHANKETSKFFTEDKVYFYRKDLVYKVCLSEIFLENYDSLEKAEQALREEYYGKSNCCVMIKKKSANEDEWEIMGFCDLEQI